MIGVQKCLIGVLKVSIGSGNGLVLNRQQALTIHDNKYLKLVMLFQNIYTYRVCKTCSECVKIDVSKCGLAAINP